VVIPAIPAPMIQTSVRIFSFSRDWDGVFAVAIQMDVVACESSFIVNGIGLISPIPSLLLRRRANVHVNLLITTKPASTKYKQRTYYKDYKDYENRHDSGACSAATIVCHSFILLII